METTDHIRTMDLAPHAYECFRPQIIKEYEL